MAFAIRLIVVFTGLVKQLVKYFFALRIDCDIFAAKAAGGIDNNALFFRRAGAHGVLYGDLRILRYGHSG